MLLMKTSDFWGEAGGQAAFPRGGCLFLGLVLIGLVMAAAPVSALMIASPWADHKYAKSRLVAAQHAGKLMAFVEIDIPEGWKTYWRNPGDAGGLPPDFDFSGSGNLKNAEVLYPAPKRMTDEAGTTIGYKGQVLFPVALEASDPGSPIKLKLALRFGVCKDICIPLEVNHALSVEKSVTGEATGALAKAVQSVPQEQSGFSVTKAVAHLDGTPRLSFHVVAPTGQAVSDIFVEAPDGLYVPMVQPGSKGQFDARFSSGDDLKALIGKQVIVTLVGSEGSGVASVPVTQAGG